MLSRKLNNINYKRRKARTVKGEKSMMNINNKIDKIILLNNEYNK